MPDGRPFYWLTMMGWEHQRMPFCSASMASCALLLPPRGADARGTCTIHKVTRQRREECQGGGGLMVKWKRSALLSVPTPRLYPSMSL